jgi:RimJ/RimL family protein N-acetyltransferase
MAAAVILDANMRGRPLADMSTPSDAPSSAHVRGLLDADLALLVHWLAAPDIWRYLAVTPYPSEAELRRWLTAAATAVVIAERADQPVGFARLALGEGRWSGVSWLTIACSLSEQGRGTGRLLLDAAHDVARHLGQRKVIAQMYAENYRARRLYDSYGYRQEAAITNGSLYDGKPSEGVHLARDLANTSQQEIR